MPEKTLGNNTYEDYLALEAESDVKYEFHDGFITAMAGGTPEHGEVAINFAWALKTALKKANKSCKIYSSDVKVHIGAVNRSFYPDVSIVCGTKKISNKDSRAITNPLLLLEVLSKTAAAFDQGEKFGHYRHLSSLQEYVIINPEKLFVETYYRNPQSGLWDIQLYTTIDDIIPFKSLDCQVAMTDIYDGIFEN